MRVTAARDAKEARQLWPLGRYHLVVLDLMLPGETGLDFATLAAQPGATCRSSC